MVNGLKKIALVLTIFVLSTSINAFRLYTAISWEISRADPTIWVQFDPEFFALEFEENEWELEQLDNPLAGIAATDQAREIIRLSMNEYNNIKGAYVRLNFVPDASLNLPVLDDAANDQAYDDNKAFKRKIRIQTFGADGVTAGVTRPVTDDTDSFNCEINISSIKKPRQFKTTLIHELGHCLGLGHAHADRDAIMGYNTPANIHSLGVDDKMGIIYLYPEDEAYAREVATLGLACSPKD